jgi:hypothetical protein
LSPMKRILLLSALLTLGSAAAWAQDKDDDGPGEKREVEVIKAGPGHGHAHQDMDDDDEDGPGERGGGPKGGPGGGMRRMMIMKEHMGGGGVMGFEPDPAMKEKHEKVRAAERKLHELRRKLHDAKGAEKDALKKDAKAAVGELFDAKLAMEQGMLDKMSEHLAEKKAKLAKRKEAREKLVQEKTDQLTGDAAGWDD